VGLWLKCAKKASLLSHYKYNITTTQNVGNGRISILCVALLFVLFQKVKLRGNFLTTINGMLRENGVKAGDF
jgi:hypothetical protein